MSRLEPNAEPSMEEILASIRRIIAEEPAGARPKPLSPRADSPLTPAPAPQRGFMSREAFLRSSQPAEPETSEPQFSTPTSPSSAEPTADAGNRNGASSSASHNDRFTVGPVASASGSARPSGLFPTEPARTSRASDLVSDLSPEPKTNPGGKDESSREIEAEATFVSASELQADNVSIDQQLARLLDDDLSALREGKSDQARSAVDDADTGSADASDNNSVRANFPGTRAGYTNGSSETHDSSDPFAFDLGPSPFLKSAPEPIAVDRRPASAIEAPASPRADNGTGGRPYTANGAAAAPIAAQPVAPSAPPAQSAPVSAAPEPAPSSASTSRQGTAFGVPSVAATLGPYRKLEPLSASFRTAADDRGTYSTPSAAGAPADTPRNALSRTDERRERFDRLDPTTPDTVPLSSSSASAPGETSADRAMEDAVADLLRPLLKTWLAENMPKIVERALRREITERLLPPGGKNNSD